MSEPIEANWDISLNVDCPGCKSYVDLLNASDFWEYNRTIEIGQHGTAETDALDVVCPECGHEFVVKCVY